MPRTIRQMRKALQRAGFVIGIRDNRLNTDFPGKYMVAEAYDESDLPTKDGSNGPWCIVGDNLEELIVDAYHNATPFDPENDPEKERP